LQLFGREGIARILGSAPLRKRLCNAGGWVGRDVFPIYAPRKEWADAAKIVLDCGYIQQLNVGHLKYLGDGLIPILFEFVSIGWKLR
jgi:hypothetical protein